MMIIGKELSILGMLCVLFFHISSMESVKQKKWYEHIDFLVELFGQKNIQGRPRQMHRDTSEKTVPTIDQMAHTALFDAISKNDLGKVRNLYIENNSIDINYRENEEKQTLLIAALKNFKNQQKKQSTDQIKNAKAIIGIMCDPSRSISMDTELLGKAQLLAKKYSEKYEIPELMWAIGLIGDNKKAYELIRDNCKKLKDPEELKNFQKLTGVREDSFLLAAKLQKKNRGDGEPYLAKNKNEAQEAQK